MKIILALFILVTALNPLYSFAGEGGLSLSQTRVIYPGSKDSVSINIRNSSTKDMWLLRGWIEDESGVRKNNTFIVTPPLYRLDPDSNIQLRINSLDVKFLPVNKESLFYLNVMAIPPQEQDESVLKKNSTITFSITNRIKMFYRPESISDKNKVVTAYGKITAKQNGKKVVLFNPSPYYLTIDGLNINKVDVQGKSRDFMLSPEGSLTIDYSDRAENISYKVIDDYGGMSEIYHINI